LGKKDILCKKYMGNPIHFAEAFNFFLYRGHSKIDPADLSPLDTTEIAVPYGNGARLPVQKYRDVLKQWKTMTDGKTLYTILGIENQSDVHYAMPVKNGLYDFLYYSMQVEEAGKSYKSKKLNKGKNRKPVKATLSRAEYLSGFRKEDRLMPVITLVVFFNPARWDGPESIHEMLNTKDEELLQYVPDYKIHLLTPYNMKDEDFEKFYTDFGKLLKYIKYSNDEKALYRITHEGDFYQNIDTESALLMNEMTGSKLQLNEEGGKVNMCKAIDDMRLHCREEGKVEGREEGRAEGRVEGKIEGKEETRLEAIKNVMDSFRVTAQQAMESLKIPTDEYPKYMARL